MISRSVFSNCFFFLLEHLSGESLCTIQCTAELKILKKSANAYLAVGKGGANFEKKMLTC